MKFLAFPFFLLLCVTLQAQHKEIIFKVKEFPTYQQADKSSTGIKQIDSINANYGCLFVKQLKTGKKSKNKTFIATFPDEVSTENLINDYMHSGLIAYAETDAIGSGGGILNPQVTANDTFYFRQWGLNNDGSFLLSPAVAGADIEMENAWEIQQGSDEVVVAVMDSGLKLNHPEFSGRLWVNQNEIAGNNIDDDENGYIDDINGWDYANADNNPTDDLGHGTNVTGIIAANGDNNLGYTGIDLNCKVMVLKGLNADNNGNYSWWAEAITYATDQGADIINLSVGGTGFSNTLGDAIQYAIDNNVVVVACMMNTNTDIPYYPAKFPGVIAVGSTNPDDKRSVPFFWDNNSGSNYGSHISVVAPGNYTYGLSAFSDTDYNTYWGGTSQATPHVVGVCALLRAQNPSLTPAEIKSIIENTAEDQVGNPLEDIEGFDYYYGHGRLNAFNALNSLLEAPKFNKEQIELTVYPNPSEGIINVLANNYPVTINVYNTLGQKILEKEITAIDNTISLTLPSIYHITAKMNGSTISKKIIIK